MAATKHTRRRRGKDGSDPSGELQDRIEAKRRRLQASAVLIALVYSLTHLVANATFCVCIPSALPGHTW